MLKSTLCAAVVIAGTFASSAVQANSSNPWADCGLGAMVFPDNGTAATLSNIIWDLGTTAVSSNVSSADSCKGANVKTAQFIQQTFPILEQEIAQGEGEYIAAMLNVRGCEVNNHNVIVSAIRNDYAQKPAKNAQDLYNIVESKVTSQFSTACSTI